MDVKTQTRNWRWLAAWLALPLTGCALGSVRQVKVDALGRYDEARGVAVEVKGEVPDAMKQQLQESFQRGVEARARRPAVASACALARPPKLAPTTTQSESIRASGCRMALVSAQARPLSMAVSPLRNEKAGSLRVPASMHSEN